MKLFRKRSLSLFLAVCITILSLVVLSGFTRGQTFSRRLSPSRYYTIVTVHTNDTLWGIAQQYRTADCGSIRSYIHEIMQVNNLKSSRIFTGQKLAVPYIP